jgi:ATP synthase F0 subunit b
MDSLITTFHIDFKIIIAQLINFAIVFAVLYWFALKPLMKVMSNRTETIEKGLNDAKVSADKLSQAEKEYSAMVIKARQESQEILKAAKEDATQNREQILKEAKEEVAKVVTQGKNQLAQEKLTMIQEAKAEVISLVVEGVKKVLGDTVSKEIDASAFKKSLKE